MGSIFCDREGVLLADYLDKCHSFTEAYYADPLRQLREKNKQTQHIKLLRILFHQVDVPAHRSTVGMAVLQKCGLQLVGDPRCSHENQTEGRWSSFCQR